MGSQKMRERVMDVCIHCGPADRCDQGGAPMARAEGMSAKTRSTAAGSAR